MLLPGHYRAAAQLKNHRIHLAPEESDNARVQIQ